MPWKTCRHDTLCSARIDPQRSCQVGTPPCLANDSQMSWHVTQCSVSSTGIDAWQVWLSSVSKRPKLEPSISIMASVVRATRPSCLPFTRWTTESRSSQNWTKGSSLGAIADLRGKGIYRPALSALLKCTKSWSAICRGVWIDYRRKQNLKVQAWTRTRGVYRRELF